MSLLLYKIFLFLYSLGIRIAAIANKKAKSWINGRRNWQQQLKDFVRQNTADTLPVVWMHCASLGEFEQGRPVLEAIKTNYPSVRILLTFFSPSGYEVRKNYPMADQVMYLPSDNAFNAKKFIRLLQPNIVIWVKYEYWYHYLMCLQKTNTPVLLISSIFRKSQPFFAWYGKIWRKMLHSFTHIFVQNQDSERLLADLGLSQNVSVSGDTRFDRVISIAQQFEPLDVRIQNFCGQEQVLVAGSTWEDDEAEWVHYVASHPEYRYIFVPHEIHPEHIQSMQKLFPKSILYSELMAGNHENLPHVLIVDHIGILSKLYHYATICYIGGGFNESGIHNTLEAAVYEKPVIFGPVYEKFAEAVGLIEAGAAFSIQHALELEKLLDELLSSPEKRKASGAASKQYVWENQGATKKILSYIQANRLLTK